MAPRIQLRSPLLDSDEEDAFPPSLPSVTPSPDTSIEDAPNGGARSNLNLDITDGTTGNRVSSSLPTSRRTESTDQQYWPSRTRSHRNRGSDKVENAARYETCENLGRRRSFATNEQLESKEMELQQHSYSFDRSPSDSFEIDELNGTPEHGLLSFSNDSSPHGGGTRKERWNISRLLVIAAAVTFLLSITAISGYFHEPLTEGIGHAWSASSQLFKDSKMESCGMCASSPATCGKYGREALELTRSYTGTGARLRRVMAKAERGEKITVGILGGSVSEGIGVPANRRWHEIVAGWFETTFPNNEVELVNGAVPGRGTEYFMSCHSEHITPEVDIVLIELGVNDWHSGHPYDDDAETLVRSILNYPKRPAVIFAESFSLTLPKLSSGMDAHIGVAHFYDIPVVSLRNWLLPELMRNPKLKDSYFFGDRDGTGKHNDYLHISIAGHTAFGDIINALLDQQHCRYLHTPPSSSPLQIAAPWPSHHGRSGDDPKDDVPTLPRLRLKDHWSDDAVIPVPQSKCLSLNSPHPESRLTFNEERTNGWSKWDDDVPWRNVKSYLRGDNPGDRIVFSNIEITSGTWTLYYLRSNKKRLGNLRCWVDDQMDQAIYVEGWWERQMDVGEVLPMHTGISIGPHDITCEIDGRTNDPEEGHMFLIIALMYS